MLKSHPPHDCIIDARQQPCPQPLLMLKRALKNLTFGQVVLLKATDPHSQQDIRYFCQHQKLQLLLSQSIDNEFHFYIEKT
jgi:tRNA 2-thiouridine synthesizing protein A